MSSFPSLAVIISLSTSPHLPLHLPSSPSPPSLLSLSTCPLHILSLLSSASPLAFIFLPSLLSLSLLHIHFDSSYTSRPFKYFSPSQIPPAPSFLFLSLVSLSPPQLPGGGQHQLALWAVRRLRGRVGRRPAARQVSVAARQVSVAARQVSVTTRQISVAARQVCVGARQVSVAINTICSFQSKFSHNLFVSLCVYRIFNFLFDQGWVFAGSWVQLVSGPDKLPAGWPQLCPPGRLVGVLRATQLDEARVPAGPCGAGKVGYNTGPCGAGKVGYNTGPCRADKVGYNTGRCRADKVGYNTGPCAAGKVSYNIGPCGAGYVGYNTSNIYMQFTMNFYIFKIL